MSLPIITGTGFLISDGVEVQFSKAGKAYARLPLSLKNNRKDQGGNWVHDKEILIQGVAFGALAEHLADTVHTKQDLRFTGELYTEEYEGKVQTKMTVHSAWPARDPESAAPSNSRPADAPPF